MAIVCSITVLSINCLPSQQSLGGALRGGDLTIDWMLKDIDLDYLIYE